MISAANTPLRTSRTIRKRNPNSNRGGERRARPDMGALQSALGADTTARNLPADSDPSRALRGWTARRGSLDLRRHFDLNNVVLDGVHHQIADRMKTQFAHDVAAMRFHGLCTEVQ